MENSPEMTRSLVAASMTCSKRVDGGAGAVGGVLGELTGDDPVPCGGVDDLFIAAPNFDELLAQYRLRLILSVNETDLMRLLRHLFETTVARCIEEGLASGQRMAAAESG